MQYPMHNEMLMILFSFFRLINLIVVSGGVQSYAYYYSLDEVIYLFAFERHSFGLKNWRRPGDRS